LEGCLPGAKIEVEMSGVINPVAQGISGGGRDVVAFTNPLHAGASLRLASWPASQPSVLIGSVPTDFAQLPPLTIDAPIFLCARGIAVSGGFPGAMAVVFFNGALLGLAQIGPEGWVHIPLTSPLPVPGSVIIVAQDRPPGHPKLTGTAQPVVAKVLATKPGPLPTPVVVDLKPDGTLPGCLSVIHLANIVPGASIEGRFANGHIITWTPLTTNPLLALPNPISDMAVRLTQQFFRCGETAPSAPVTATIGMPETLPPISIADSCPGSTNLHVSGLWGGSTLTVTTSEGSWPYQLPADVTMCDIPVGSLPIGAVTVIEQACGETAQATAEIVKATTTAAPTIDGPVYRCGSKVLVINTGQPGMLRALVEQKDGTVLQRSADKWFAAGEAVVKVTPPFGDFDDAVWVELTACGGVTTASPREPVRSHPVLPLVQAIRPISPATSVRLDHVVPGAQAFVFARGRPEDPAVLISRPTEMVKYDSVVPLVRPLKESEFVQARLRMCRDAQVEAPWVQVTPGYREWSLPAFSAELAVGARAGDPVDVNVSNAMIKLNHNGAWRVEAAVTNTTHLDIDFLLELFVKDPAGTKLWGSTLEGNLSGGDQNGLALWGYPKTRQFFDGSDAKTKPSAVLLDTDQWIAIVSASSGHSFLPTPWR
jgi:hypothetical protein